MYPNRESPVAAAHKVRMVVRDAQIIHGFHAAGVVGGFERQPAAVAGCQEVADLQFAGGGPTAGLHVERVFRRRVDHLPADRQVEHHALADEEFLDELAFHRPIDRRLIAGEDHVAGLELLDGLFALRREHRRAGQEVETGTQLVLARWAAGDSLRPGFDCRCGRRPFPPLVKWTPR